MKHIKTILNSDQKDSFIPRIKKKKKKLFFGVSLTAQLVKNPPGMQETLVQLLGWEDPLDKG